MALLLRLLLHNHFVLTFMNRGQGCGGEEQLWDMVPLAVNCNNTPQGLLYPISAEPADVYDHE